MKIDVRTDQEAQSSGLDVGTMNFDMTKTAKLFHMLSSTLYSNKISSIIRELASNAYDSHKMKCNLDTPFVLTGPTFENPVFEIRDFGVGLTQQEAEKTILCYLGSSKDSTDDFIGGWGIGSKSPFAYASTYEVTVFKDGYEVMFTCWKDENGIPNKAVINEGSTTEQNGVRMRVPVEISDIRNFNENLKEYKKWTNYNVRVIVDDEEVPESVVVVEKDFENFKVKVYQGGGGTHRLVYGGFGYDMRNCVDNQYDYASTWRRLENLLSYNYSIAFVIDTPNLVSFNMNREVLEQTDKSRSFIKKIVEEFYTFATKKESVVKDLKQDTLSHDKVMKMNLKEFDESVDKLLETLSEEDNQFSRIFKSEIELSYHFKDNSIIRNLTTRGVYPATRVNLKLQKSEDILVICYGARAKPGPTDRGNFYYNNRSGLICNSETVFLYVKAKSEDECKKILSNTTDFEGYDLSKLRFLEVNITPRQTTTYSRGSGHQFITCSLTKTRKKIDENTYFVYGTKDELDELKNNKIDFYLSSINEDHFFFVPNSKFEPEDERYEDIEQNLFTVDEFKEFVDVELEKKRNNSISYFLHNKLRYGKFMVDGFKYEYTSCYNLINGFTNKLYKLNTIHVPAVNKRYNMELPYEFRPSLSSIKKLVREFKEIEKEAQKYQKWISLINFRELVNDESDKAKLLKEFLEKEGVYLTKD